MLKNKETGKRRKLYHFNQFIKDYTYYDYARFEYNGHKGYIYITLTGLVKVTYAKR